MKAFKFFSASVALFVTMPIWYYLVYSILKMVNATDIMWFLFWIYVPAGIGTQIILKLAEVVEKK